MKYLLLDLTVLASFIIATRKLLGGGDSLLAPECNATYVYDDTNQTSTPTPRQYQAPIPRQLRQLQQHHQQQQQHAIPKIGDMVEVYDPKIDQDYAFFAEISGNITHDDGSIKYEIRAGPWDEIFQDIDASSIRAHKPLDFRRHAMCDYSKTLGSSSRLTPCIILSYSNDERRTYYVSGIVDDEVRHHQMLMSRIRPIVSKMSSALEDEFKRLNPTDPPRYDDSNNLQLIGVVELYDDTSYTAAPLIITSFKEDGRYNLHHTFSSTHFSAVDPTIVSPYHVYGDGTDALCKVGELESKNTIHCTVVSHSIAKTGCVWYSVSYLDEGKPLKNYLLFTDVERIIKKRILRND